eukprot:433246-Pleurochrysis_carterae.AAC.1
MQPAPARRAQPARTDLSGRRTHALASSRRHSLWVAPIRPPKAEHFTADSYESRSRLITAVLVHLIGLASC